MFDFVKMLIRFGLIFATLIWVKDLIVEKEMKLAESGQTKASEAKAGRAA